MTDSGDGGEGGGDELPCATEGEGGEDKNTHVCVVFAGVPGLMFTKLPAGTEQVMDFIIMY